MTNRLTDRVECIQRIKLKDTKQPCQDTIGEHCYDDAFPPKEDEFVFDEFHNSGIGDGNVLLNLGILMDLPRPPAWLVDLSERILVGDRFGLARGITLVESSLSKDREAAYWLLERLSVQSRQGIRIAVTGPPGAGKSTLIGTLGGFFADRGARVAVLAVDPSSPLTGGSILGDKTRMGKLAGMENAFIRPSPSAGISGGVSAHTRETILLCEAAGFDTIIVETVGSGQGEYQVRDMVDALLLVLIPGAGDSVQGMKRGVLELADFILINKADGDHLPAAQKAKSELVGSLQLFADSGMADSARVSLCSALTGEGIGEICSALEDWKSDQKSNGNWERRRKQQRLVWLSDKINEAFLSRQPLWQEWLERRNKVINAMEESQMNEFAALRYVVEG